MKAPANIYRQDDSCLFLRDLERRGDVWDGDRLDDFMLVNPLNLFLGVCLVEASVIYVFTNDRLTMPFYLQP